MQVLIMIHFVRYMIQTENVLSVYLDFFIIL